VSRLAVRSLILLCLNEGNPKTKHALLRKKLDRHKVQVHVEEAIHTTKLMHPEKQTYGEQNHAHSKAE